MTETTYAGVLKTALNLIPVLNDPEQPHYEIQKTDSAASVVAKIYDAFLYGLSDEQFQMLENSAAASPARAKELALIKSWLDDAAPILDEELDPADMGPYADRFAEFPSLDDAGDDEDVLAVSWALLQLADVDELPSALAKYVKALEPYIFPDFADVMGELFPAEEKPARRQRRTRAKATEKPAETPAPEASDEGLDAIIEGSELTEQEAADLDGSFELGEGVDVPLSAEDAAEVVVDESDAEAEAEAQAEAEAAEKAAAEEQAEAEAEAAEKAAADKKAAEKKAAEKKAAEKKAADKKAADKKAADKKAAAEKEAADKKPAKRGRTLKRTGGGGSGIMADMRRLVVMNPEIPFTDVEHVMTSRNVDCKKSTWSPKLSDMRNMLNYLLDLDVIDKAKLEQLSSLKDIAALDEDLTPEQAEQMDTALKALDS